MIEQYSQYIKKHTVYKILKQDIRIMLRKAKIINFLRDDAIYDKRENYIYIFQAMIKKLV